MSNPYRHGRTKAETLELYRKIIPVCEHGCYHEDAYWYTPHHVFRGLGLRYSAQCQLVCDFKTPQ